MNSWMVRALVNLAGYLFAIGYVAVLSVFFYLQLHNAWEQNLMIAILLGSGFVCGFIGHEMRLSRRTYHDFETPFSRGEKVGPVEQKLDQVCIIHTLLVWILVLIQAAPVLGWDKFFK